MLRRTSRAASHMQMTSLDHVTFSTVSGVCRLLPLSAWAPLSAVSCLQMTARRMFFAWSHRCLPREPRDDADNQATEWIRQDFDPDIIIGYSADGDEVSVSMDQLVTIFGDPDFFESLEEVDGGKEIIQLPDGAARKSDLPSYTVAQLTCLFSETAVFCVDFSPL